MRDLELKILKYLTEHSETVNSTQLADFCGVSKKTVQNRISSLNEEIKDCGVCIRGIPSSGYQMIVTDTKKAKCFFESFKDQINSPLFERNTDYNVNYIVRRLLSVDDYLSMDILCDELYYSKNSVKKDLSAADQWLQDFGLSLTLKKRYGYYIDGPEWKKRVALLSQDKLFVNLPQNIQAREKNYIHMLGIDARMGRKWYQVMLKYMRKSSKLSLSAIDFPIATHYIALIPTRAKFQNLLSFSQEQEEALAQSGLSVEADRILHLFEGQISVNEIEIKSFAMILLAFRTVTSLNQLTADERKTLEAEVNEILDFLKNRVPSFDISNENEAFTERLMMQWYYVRNRLLFDLIPDEEYMRPGIHFQYLSPVSDLMEAIQEYASLKFKNVKKEQIYSLSYLFQEYAENKRSQHKAAVVSLYGYSYACCLAKKVEEKYGFFFREIKVLEYTQMNEDLDTEYDFLIADLRDDMYPNLKNCKILQIDETEDRYIHIPFLDHFEPSSNTSQHPAH